MKHLLSLIVLFLSYYLQIQSAELFLEAESFEKKGGWSIDQQFMDLMGSSYLIAHGLGTPVDDATTTVNFPQTGTYYIYVRTYNWTSPWYTGDGPGKFTLTIDGQPVKTELGTTGNSWMWQEAGKINIKNTQVKIGLRDLSGFDGRCDAIYFTTNKDILLPVSDKALQEFRNNALKIPSKPQSAGSFDFVVIGGGIAGISAAVSAARLGCKVALVNDRPILGGNNSSEVRVHLGGRIEVGPYKALGSLQKEFGHSRGGNAQPAEFYEDSKKEEIVKKEKNITFFPNYRAISVKMDGKKIKSITAKHIENSQEIELSAPIFSDCTGDGTIGYLAGADYLMGREGRDEFGEDIAPAKADKMTMGASVHWYSKKEEKTSKFPHFHYGINFNDENCEKVTMGEWTWETGMNKDQIKDFERIRDYGLLVVYSNWSYLKNDLKDNSEYKKRKLDWVAYIAGKRESRRLLGDYILKQDDIEKNVFHEDGSATTTWSIDLHFPDPKNSKHFPGNEFKAETKHINIYPYPIPYRCLYSRNIDNLFMAGRNISVTHVALGTTRVMRTTGMMGEVVGMAASLCKKYNTFPRQIYFYHLNALKALMTQGVGNKELPNNQVFNLGGTLSTPQPFPNR